MLLVIDVGNTNTVLGLYDGDTLAGHWRVSTTNYRTADELSLLYSMVLHHAGKPREAIAAACISSVVPQLNHALMQVCHDAFGVRALMVGPGIKTGLILQIENPKEVGADRIVNAIGAIEEYPGPLIVVDFGTATTFDVITDKHEYRGGVIVPGVNLSAEALFQHCARLPRVDITVPTAVIGRDTVSNIRSGLTYGYADMVDGLVGRMVEEMGVQPTVVATGGLAEVMKAVAKRIDVVDALLTLKGLKAIYNKNARPAK